MYISDTTAPLSQVFFPSVAICNFNQVFNGGILLINIYSPQVKLSLLEKAGMNFDTKQEETKYLTNYFLQGAKKSHEPENWNVTLENIQKKLGWNESFAKSAAQVRYLPTHNPHHIFLELS